MEKIKKGKIKLLKMQKMFLKLKKDDKRITSIKEQNEAIKYRVIRGIRDPFDQEKEDYYKPAGADNFWSKSCADNMKAMRIEIKHYHLNTILIKLDLT